MKTNKECEVIRLTGLLEGLTRTYNSLTKVSSDSRYNLTDEINRIESEIQITKNIIMEEEILEAKRRLYLLLMKLNEDSITDNEVDIMFLLSKDEQIQSLFEIPKKK
jgi:hypothetical protein